MFYESMCVLSVLQAELVRVQEDGKRRIAEAKEKGRLQYNELVATIEKRYVAEFESSLKIVKERADADAKVRARVVLCPRVWRRLARPFICAPSLHTDAPVDTAPSSSYRSHGGVTPCALSCRGVPQACESLEEEIRKARAAMEEVEKRGGSAEEERRREDVALLQVRVAACGAGAEHSTRA
jgi:hypothetical protein